MFSFARRVNNGIALAAALVALCDARGAVAQVSTATDARAVSIALLTVGPGTSPPSWFGHSALIVDDGSAGGARIYAYGVIPRSLRTIAAAIAGHVTAYATAQPARAELARLKASGRTIRIQDLALPQQSARRLASQLQMQAERLPLSYTYDALRDNCSTRIRDLIDGATGGSLHATLAAIATNRTQRDAGIAAMGGYSALAMLVDLVVGRAADARVSAWDLASFPDDLADGVARASLASDRVRIERATHKESKAVLWSAGMVAGLALVLAGMNVRGNERRARTVIGIAGAGTGLALGVPGLVIAWAGIFGAHATMAHNTNIFFANPLTFALLPLGIACCAGSVRATAWLPRVWTILAAFACIGAGFTLLGSQNSARIIALIVPMLVGGAIASRAALLQVRRAPFARRVFLPFTS